MSRDLPADTPATFLLQVETEDRFEWIGGSSIGGGTFWGLGALLTKTKVLGSHGRKSPPTQDVRLPPPPSGKGCLGV